MRRLAACLLMSGFGVAKVAFEQGARTLAIGGTPELVLHASSIPLIPQVFPSLLFIDAPSKCLYS